MDLAAGFENGGRNDHLQITSRRGAQLSRSLSPFPLYRSLVRGRGRPSHEIRLIAAAPESRTLHGASGLTGKTSGASLGDEESLGPSGSGGFSLSPVASVAVPGCSTVHVKASPRS
jgi:hypothetical protein